MSKKEKTSKSDDLEVFYTIMIRIWRRNQEIVIRQETITILGLNVRINKCIQETWLTLQFELELPYRFF